MGIGSSHLSVWKLPIIVLILPLEASEYDYWKFHLQVKKCDPSNNL